MTATFTGVHAHDHHLPDWSEAAWTREVEELRGLRERLDREWPAPPRVEALADDPARLDAELARANIDVRIAERASGFFQERNPALFTGEAIFGLVSLMSRDFAPAPARIEALHSRLLAIPTFLEAMRTVIRGPVPALWVEKAQRECTAACELLEVGLPAWLHTAATANAATANAATADGTTLQTHGVLDMAVASATDAFTAASEWLQGVEVAEPAAYAAGPDLLELLLRRGHWCEETPRALLARAEQAMHAEQERLASMLEAFGGDWSAAQRAMAEDRPTVDDYYGVFRKRWDEVREAAQRADIVTWPEWPIRYVPIPAWARSAQPQLYWLFYRSPAPFDPYTEYEYVVTPIECDMPADEQDRRLRAWNHSVITLNHVVHHGGIGHHVQNWHAIHRSSSRVGTVAAVDAASRIGMFLGGTMAEGWACYATQLAEELGVLTPLEQLSEQHTRVRLLARALVDLGLHLGDWSFDACAAFYQSTVGMTAAVARAETTKNSMFPGTALMYWLGTSTILETRERLRHAMGDAFSLKAFHDALLSRGAIPVPLAVALVHTDLRASTPS